ncbi:isocitrate lyase/PEP mutase family protein [Parasphingopyxis lamellibrachiae]|uniref:2-methylisocitrate lyase-like PEP mutase family enzyme n=1 Tax=Parasphingopyxis lamellibrachiae TaxID=680125 RepID=A0A3D9FFJ1_9SPHN|nr:isocitrate lyase/phosphoenolpyruvate mutase family protein [Parasphingopyxis lamellibrachiae]RED16559.1 2-methylisocitrate lyase-like PEP mutase family enzyme [Parasphingopyxis lamellibrachiae]
MKTLVEKGRAFRALHETGEPFVLANAWDGGSARLLQGAGAVAIGTTSAGFAFSIGKVDNETGRDAILENARTIAAATDLPVSGDLENGFGADAGSVAETIRRAGAAGLVGGSIEDSTYDARAPLYETGQAVERIEAAMEAARSLPFDFTLTARAENYLAGRPDLADTIARLQAYQDAGAHVLYAPGLTDPEDIRSVVSSVDRPVNVVVGLSGTMPDLDAFRDLGVARLSIGSAYARLAYGEVVRAMEAILKDGNFDALAAAMPYGAISERLS